MDPADLYLAHIGGIDIIARALLAAADVVTEGALAKLRTDRYAGWQGELGQKISSGSLNLPWGRKPSKAPRRRINLGPRAGRRLQ